MIINHNMMAMNTHRQLGINANNSQKSIEKLSSGMRINRAGDDAAGLAISEKMRSQIRGLDQASRNSQDAISLIQTAEGALGETQSILQRMRELAVQSANSTNVDSDRAEIQKELNQLTSEINRIGNTTEFNTQNLLNGGEGVARTGNLAVNVTQYADNGVVYDGTDTLDITGGTAATGSVSKMATDTNSVKAGTIELDSATVVTSSVTEAKAGTVGAPVTEITASIDGGSGVIQGDAGLEVVKGADAVAGDAYALLNFVETQASGAAANQIMTVNMADLLKDGINDGDTISFGGTAFTAKASGAGANEFNIGHTQEETIANLAEALNDSATIVDNAGNNVTVTSAASIVTFTVDADNVNMKWNATEITANTVAKAQLSASARESVYTFEVSENFSADDKITIGGVTYTATATGTPTDAVANTFEVKGTTAETVDELFAAMAADHAGYTLSQEAPQWLWTDDATSITITGNAGGVDAAAATFTTGLTVTQSPSELGEYKFELESNFEVGSTITIAGEEFTAVAENGGADNSATAFEVGANINATTANIIAAMKLNGTLNTAYNIDDLKTGAGTFVGTGNDTDLDTIILQEKNATGQAAITVASADRVAVNGEYSFEVNENFSVGDYVEIDGEKFTAVDATAVPVGNEFKIVDGDIESTVDNLVAKITANSATYTAAKADSTFFDGNKVVLTEISASGADLDTTIETGAGASTGKIKQGNINEVLGKYEFLVTDNLADGDVLKIDGEYILAGGAEASAGIDGDFAVGAAASDTATNIADAINNADATSSQALQDLKAKYTVAAVGDKLSFTEKDASGVDLADTDVAIGTNDDGGTGTTVEIKEAYEFTAVALDKDSVVNVGGTDITITTHGTADMVAAELKTQIEDASNLDTAALRAAYDVTVADEKITLTQKVAADQTDISGNYSTTDHDGFEAKMQIGANTGQSITLDVGDMRARALNITGIESGADVKSASGEVASFVATQSASNGTDDTLTEYTLDVSTFDKATAAVSVIDDAISAVSAERSKLGAFQNRLDHTISNLNTSSENLTASESRIRDVDMAKEMMAYTKNNILQQAAQSMLAQANKAPEAVLQLLR